MKTFVQVKLRIISAKKWGGNPQHFLGGIEGLLAFKYFMNLAQVRNHTGEEANVEGLGVRRRCGGRS